MLFFHSPVVSAGEGGGERAEREKERQERRDRWCGTIKIAAGWATRKYLRDADLAHGTWGAFRLPAGGHQHAANEARDTASLWKHRGLTSILKRCVHPPCAPSLFINPVALLLPPSPSRPVPPPGIAGALHLPAPFKARNSTRRSQPIPEVRERRRRDGGSR